MNLRHKSNIGQDLGVCFYLGKNVLSTFAFSMFAKVCVAAIGAVHFYISAWLRHAVAADMYSKLIILKK